MVSWYSDNINLAPVHTITTPTYSTKSALSNNEARTLGTYNYDTSQDLDSSEAHNIAFSYVSFDYPDTVFDVDGNEYNTIFIGTQQWMVENLKTTKYADGTPIPNISNYNDWFLPSRDELIEMYDELKVHGVGGFQDAYYWSSTENSATGAYSKDFQFGSDGVGSNKDSIRPVRACRSFTSVSPSYNLRDTGPAGGFIFWKSGNDYLEASPTDLSLSSAWSNIINVAIGTTGTAVGTGQANTTAIINQTVSVSDWFLPSQLELDAMRTELYNYSVGNFKAADYPSSSQSTSFTWAYVGINFPAGTIVDYSAKASNPGYFRPCRSFVGSVGEYSIRGTGPTGGLIFAYSGGRYYECPLQDIDTVINWSNITTNIVGTGTAIGTGQANTTLIINQVGHTNSVALLCDSYSVSTSSTSSAAKLCNDLTSNMLWAADTTGAYCWYNNDIANKTPYGALYNWYAVDNAHGLAPTGWRIPSAADWATLITYAGGDAVAGGKLKEIGLSHWLTPNTGATDDYGFKALGSGYRLTIGHFDFDLEYFFPWSSTESDVDNAVYKYISHTSQIIGGGPNSKINGFAVRCMRDIV